MKGDSMKVNVINLGVMKYNQTLKIQEKLRKMRIDKVIEDTLLIVEHEPVITLGCRGNKENIKISKENLSFKGINIYQTNRGGDVTYHGPGQIVGYPILDLYNHDRSVKKLVWKLKEIFIRLLKDIYNIEAIGLDKEYTGVWINDSKITAIGIAISRMVTMHGFAFNVNTDLEYFKWITPCGLEGKGVTSLKELTGDVLDIEKVKRQVIDYFLEVFNVKENHLSFKEIDNLMEEYE
ncbi:MAG: lipoyl(octanoyl) transferase LipB [Eubacteriaceae bacterium]